MKHYIPLLLACLLSTSLAAQSTQISNEKTKDKSSMNISIRYFSKFGHSSQMANVVADVTGAKPETVSVPLPGHTDLLFLGAGVFLGKVDKSVTAFIDSLDPAQVDCVVLFGSSAIIDSPVPQMRKRLEQRGIKVAEQSFSCKGAMGPVHAGHPNEEDLANLKQFVQQLIARP